jgi:anti-sigma factor RsiW
MTCPLQAEQTELLLEYSAGRLDVTRSAGVERHLKTCPECESFLTAQTAVWSALDLWEPAPVSVDFNRQLWQRIDAAAAEPWYKSLVETLRFANWKPVLPLTAAILLIAAGFLFDHPGGKNSVPGVSGKEAEQVEQTLDDLQLLHQLDAAIR